ncbi:MAG TPA: DUF58 domain-containing protein [Acidimicrobiales bacterium]|nr:DUF58 domain-containing protein [Acidimicrobiales bacterium]
MLTRRGWMLLAASVGCTATGRALGVIELYAVAAGIVALVVGSAVFVHTATFSLRATRELRPPRVHAGGFSRVELVLRNLGRRTAPVLTVLDPFDNGRRWARFLVAPLAPGEQARAAYRLPTERRGIFPLGPLEVQRRDPLGIANVSVEAAPVTQLTVFPRIDEILPLPYTLGQDPLAGTDHPTALGAGDEFYALRAYEMGDDLRRVHWPSTAKLDELMIRQDEMPWQGRATVVLDLRAGVHNAESLELAVSAAASIITACWRKRALLRLVMTDGTDSGFAAGNKHLDAMLERLAVVGPDRAGNIRGVLASLRRGGNGGSLVLVTTAGAADADLGGAAKLAARYGHVTVVLFERSSYDRWANAGAVATRARSVPASGPIVRVTAEEPFARAWDRAMHSRAVGARH